MIDDTIIANFSWKLFF